MQGREPAPNPILHLYLVEGVRKVLLRFFSPIPPVPEVALPLRRAARTLKSEFIFQLTLGTYCRYVCTFAGKYVYIYIGFCGVQRVVYVHIYSELLHMAPK